MTVASSSAATSTSPLPRHTPVISPLQSRPPFPLAPRQQQGGKRSAGSWLRRRAALLLPRTKVRLVVAWSILLVGTFAALFSFQILTFDLPPLDDYDVAYPPGGIQDRSFEEPDFSLLSTPQPHTIGCPQRSSLTAPLLLLGVFSSPEKIDRRTLIRREVKPDWPADLVEFRFIFGRPKGDNDEDRRKWERVLAAEQEEHGDVVIVDTVENIDSGKTHAYFEWVAEKRQGEKPQFVMKADDDTLLVMPNVIAAFQALDCSKNIYWGTSAGSTHYFPRYFRGLGYALSWPLAFWIGNADVPLAHSTKIEDARTSQWLRNLNPLTDPVEFIDHGWAMGDFNQLDLSVETVALHWLKHDDWFTTQNDKVKELWREAGLEYKPGHGVDPQRSVEAGKKEPEAARKEKERQKQMGWDV